jgi:hypothetical protein
MLQALSCEGRVRPCLARARISPRSRPREGSFDLWRPAGRFTNIKFAFKRVDAATVQRAAKAAMPPPGVARVSCVYITAAIYSVAGCCRAAKVARNLRRRGGITRLAEEFPATCLSRGDEVSR